MIGTIALLIVMTIGVTWVLYKINAEHTARKITPEEEKELQRSSDLYLLRSYQARWKAGEPFSSDVIGWCIKNFGEDWLHYKEEEKQ